MNAVELASVTHRYGKVQALDGLNLTVRQGEMFGFLGRNGAGKTTTLKLLMGLLRPDSGTITVLGRSVKRMPAGLKQRIGYVCQEPNFYPWMTADQLGAFVGSFYPTWDGPEFGRLLRMLDVPRDRRASEMSGGTRTKLGLALALAPRPELLLLDEPTAGLDPVARREFNDQLQALQREQGTTVMFSSHLVGEVEQLAQRVGIVQAGTCRFEGEVGALRTRVRRVVGDTAQPPGEGFTQLRGDIWQAEPALWNQAGWPPGTVVETLSLEDIFLAFARTDSVPA
ncbi:MULTISPECIES: ABC transporter ATP-binding protein [unclassified Massilia]|uniref:ABC transporter ATP-binding protein n=1 Tax=unclassified Massilia TaxID=2609279 RepID=UPI00177B0DBF|nr:MULTISPECIES: ABC transporter ATP-binding protein [unclassified Massilia]MBD8528944.1 ABC transporter ATP-binding protein [Massilia sp. CFBP 13647]MBD8673586.1 ABC transporter ATP-binding protein [Massilia sp. CFBP 13721]